MLIIDIIIKELFYRNDDQIFADIDEVDEEEDDHHHMNMEWIRKKAEKKIVLKCNTIKLFKLYEDNKMYMIDIPNNMCFFLMINYVKYDMTFRQTTAAIRHAKDCLKVQKLGKMNDHNVDQYALVTTNLNKIAELLLHSLV